MFALLVATHQLNAALPELGTLDDPAGKCRSIAQAKPKMLPLGKSREPVALGSLDLISARNDISAVF